MACMVTSGMIHGQKGNDEVYRQRVINATLVRARLFQLVFVYRLINFEYKINFLLCCQPQFGPYWYLSQLSLVVLFLFRWLALFCRALGVGLPLFHDFLCSFEVFLYERVVFLHGKLAHASVMLPPHFFKRLFSSFLFGRRAKNKHLVIATIQYNI